MLVVVVSIATNMSLFLELLQQRKFNVSGISTFTGKVNADGGLEVSGGVLTANNNINTSAVRRTSHTNTRLAFPQIMRFHYRILVDLYLE